jgi:DNA-binding transcriptional LysR family regulator
VDDDESDIVGGRFDAGIRVGNKVARDMALLRLTAPSRLVAVASPDYLARHKAPMIPRDLRGHACICYRNNGRRMDWVFERGKNKLEISVNGPLICDSIDLVERAALTGIGIGYTIESHVAEHLASGRLVALLRDWSPAVHSYYLYYSDRGQVPAPLKALIDWFQRGQPD